MNETTVTGDRTRSNSFDMTFLWSTIVLLGILGHLLNALLGGAERLVLSWHTDKGQD